MNIRRIVKNVLIILIISIVPIYAAIINADDGLAFISKEEFTALQDELKSTVDDYEISLESKIEGKIISYLKALPLKMVEQKIPYYDWETVTATNFAVKNDYWYPDMDLAFYQLYYGGYLNGSTQNAYQSWSAFSSLTYKRAVDRYSKRLLCDAETEKETYPDDIVWAGRALNYLDKISCSRTFFCESQAYQDGYLYTQYINGFALEFATKISAGYFRDLSGVGDEIWAPRLYWTDSNTASFGSHHGRRAVSSVYATSNLFTINLEKVNEKKLDYSHIINYDNKTYTDYFSDTDWVHTLTSIQNNSFTRKTMLNAMSKQSYVSWLDYWRPLHNSSNLNNKDEIRKTTGGSIEHYVSGDASVTTSWNTGDRDDETAMVTVGLIPKNYDGEHIFQTSKKDVFRQDVGTSSFEGPQLKLYNGFALLAAREGETIEWNPVFIKTKSNGVETNFELDVRLALGNPFGEGDTLLSGAEYILFEGQENPKAVSTKDQTCKLTFEMPRAGIVYVKWWPKDASVRATEWEATLDLTQCGTYKKG